MIGRSPITRSATAKLAGAGLDVCPPQRFKPLVHALFRNEQGKAFRNVSAEQGFTAVGCGLGVVLVDVNDDGRPDIYVANDASNKLLFINRGGKLEEKGVAAGVALDDRGVYNGSMGVDAGDYDGSGRPALWVTNFQGELHGLYRNLGGELFHYQSQRAGLGALGQQWVSFGTRFVDIDNDGWEDLLIVGGHVVYHPPTGSTVKQRPLLLHNVAHEGRRVFKDRSGRGGTFFQTPAVGRGLAIGDLDNDGWPDVVVSHCNSPVVLLRNDAAKSTPANWLGVRLVGRRHRDVVGSTVILEGNGHKRYRYVKGGGSYLSARRSAHPLRLGVQRRRAARDGEVVVGTEADVGRAGSEPLLGPAREGVNRFPLTGFPRRLMPLGSPGSMIVCHRFMEQRELLDTAAAHRPTRPCTRPLAGRECSSRL